MPSEGNLAMDDRPSFSVSMMHDCCPESCKLRASRRGVHSFISGWFALALTWHNTPPMCVRECVCGRVGVCVCLYVCVHTLVACECLCACECVCLRVRLRCVCCVRVLLCECLTSTHPESPCLETFSAKSMGPLSWERETKTLNR